MLRKTKLITLGVIIGAIVFGGGLALADHVSTKEEHVVVFDPPPMTSTIQDTDPVPHPETVTVTEPGTTTTPPTTTEPTPDPERPLWRAGGTTINSTTRWNCNQPLSNFGTLPITLNSNVTNAHARTLANGVVGFNAGCRGDGDPNTIDICLHINGNGTTLGSDDDGLVLRGGMDIQVGCGPGDHPNIDCGTEGPNAHMDGIASHEGYRMEFWDLTSGNWDTKVATCHGAGAVVYWSAGVDAATRIPSRAVDLVCYFCSIVGSKHTPAGKALGIYESTRSGAVNSRFFASIPIDIRMDTPEGPNRGAIDPINEGNTCIDKETGPVECEG